MHSVWEWDKARNEGIVLQEHYFKVHPKTKKQVDWYTDYYFPLAKKWEERVRGVVGGEKFLFLEPIPNEVGFNVIFPFSCFADPFPSSALQALERKGV